MLMQFWVEEVAVSILTFLLIIVEKYLVFYYQVLGLFWLLKVFKQFFLYTCVLNSALLE